MKTKITTVIVALAFIAMSFTDLIDKSAAKVDEQNGIKVFAFSKPTNKYDILGMVKVKGIVSNEKGPHMVELLINYAKKDYPSAEAIIINNEFQKAEVIKFKD
jgi:hypothetical protein